MQKSVFIAIVFTALIAAIASQSVLAINAATIDVKLTGQTKVVDARNNFIAGNETMVGISSAMPCDFWCGLRSFFGLQSTLNTPNNLPAGSVAKIGDFFEPPSTQGSITYSSSQIYNFVNAQVTYMDLDGQVHTGYFPRGTQFDFRILDPAWGNPSSLKSVVTYIPSNPLFPTPANCNWNLKQDGSGTLSCGGYQQQNIVCSGLNCTGYGFFQQGLSDVYSITVDTSNGISSSLVNYSAVYALNQSAQITFNFENRIANGILGGLILNERSVTYPTSTNITTLPAVPLIKGNNTFTINVPTNQLGTSEIQIVPYVRIDIPYVSLQTDPTATSGSGLKPMQQVNSWYGSSDKATVFDYQVLFANQIGPIPAGSQPYVAPYQRLSISNGSFQYTPISQSNLNWLWITSAIIIAGAIGFALARRK